VKIREEGFKSILHSPDCLKYSSNMWNIAHGGREFTREPVLEEFQVFLIKEIHGPT